MTFIWNASIESASRGEAGGEPYLVTATHPLLTKYILDGVATRNVYERVY